MMEPIVTFQRKCRSMGTNPIANSIRSINSPRRTKSGRFLRFNWACYDLGANTRTNKIPHFRRRRQDLETPATVFP